MRHRVNPFREWFRPRASLIPTCLLLSLLLAGEGLVRLSGVRKRWEFSEGAFYQWDNVLFWRLRSNFDSIVDSVRVRINRDGFRGPSIEGWDDRSLKILCLGDSVTFGYGTEDVKSFPCVLEQELEARGTPASVMNAGVPGYSSLQMERYFSELRSWHPDLLIVSLGGLAEGSATFDGVSDDRRPTGWKAHLRHGLDRSALFVFLAGLLRPAGAPVHPADREVARTRQDLLHAVAQWYHMPLRLSPECHVRALETVLDVARTDGMRVIFLAVPTNPYVEPGPSAPEKISASLVDGYLQGKEAAKKGLLGPALSIFKDLDVKYPGMAPVQFEIATIAAAMGDWALACPSYRAAYEGGAMRQRISEFQRVGMELADRQGVPVVRMEPLFETKWFQPQQTGTDLFVDTCHPSPEGHAMIAQALADSILSPPIR